MSKERGNCRLGVKSNLKKRVTKNKTKAVQKSGYEFAHGNASGVFLANLSVRRVQFVLCQPSEEGKRRNKSRKGGSDGGAPVRGYGLSQDLPAVWEYLAERCVRPCHIKCECFPLSNLITDFYGGISRSAERQSRKDGNWTFFHSE